MVETTLGCVANDANLGLTIVPIALDYGETTARMAGNIIAAQKSCAAPIVAIWMSDRLGEGYRRLVAAGFAPPRSVGKAVAAIRRWVEYGRWQRANPELQPVPLPPPIAALGAGATRTLCEAQARQRLRQAGIALLPCALAQSVDEALALAGRIGYPVAAKIASAQIAHKSDIGGVQLGLQDAAQLQTAWCAIMAAVARRQPAAVIDGLLIEKMAPRGGVELLIGVTRAPVFGHVMSFGPGGVHVEIFRELTRRLLPVGARDAAAMLRELRCFALLDGARGQPVADLDALVQLLVQVSDFVLRDAGRI